MIYNNCESHKMGATKIPREWLWHERWPVWGYARVKLVQSNLLTFFNIKFRFLKQKTRILKSNSDNTFLTRGGVHVRDIA